MPDIEIPIYLGDGQRRIHRYQPGRTDPVAEQQAACEAYLAELRSRGETERAKTLAASRWAEQLCAEVRWLAAQAETEQARLTSEILAAPRRPRIR